jgi:hypothetical protein
MGPEEETTNFFLFFLGMKPLIFFETGNHNKFFFFLITKRAKAQKREKLHEHTSQGYNPFLSASIWCLQKSGQS